MTIRYGKQHYPRLIHFAWSQHYLSSSISLFLLIMKIRYEKETLPKANSFCLVAALSIDVNITFFLFIMTIRYEKQHYPGLIHFAWSQHYLSSSISLFLLIMTIRYGKQHYPRLIHFAWSQHYLSSSISLFFIYYDDPIQKATLPKANSFCLVTALSIIVNITFFYLL